MSRIGKQPVVIPTGVSVTVSGPQVSAKGPQGELSLPVPTGMTVNVEEGRVTVGRREETRQARSLHGLTRSLIANMVKGVSQGFRKDLEIQGVGFRAQVQAARRGTLIKRGLHLLTVGYLAGHVGISAGFLGQSIDLVIERQAIEHHHFEVNGLHVPRRTYCVVGKGNAFVFEAADYVQQRVNVLDMRQKLRSPTLTGCRA